MTKTIALVCVAGGSLLLSPFVSGGDKLGQHLQGQLLSLNQGDRIAVWVFFTDKGGQEALRNNIPRSVVSERSLLRRHKVLPADRLVDYTDLPVEQSYIDRVTASGARLRQRSKWFNAVSVLSTGTEIAEIEQLPCVRKLDLVWRARRESDFSGSNPWDAPTSTPRLNHSGSLPDLNYGLSLPQVQTINVPAVHSTGNFGQGVIIGDFDNGFRLLEHEVFDSLRNRIIATYDFVDHKVSVVPNDPAPGFGAHGIVTLSTMAGYKPGELIGPAFGASFILARTENDSSETPIEEDNWVAAIEWADSIGVDVTSTSLGYLDYDPPYTSWTWEDMNGNTTLITRAADMAVGKGIVVVNSAGNNGFNAQHNTLNAPADGDSVITVGAVTSGGARASFSSVGPTTSVPPRIKPDVMATGTLVRCADASDPHGYEYEQGTSLSCPLAAGVAAMVLHAHPGLTPIQVRDVLRSTASQANAPDNAMGWGIIDALAATIGYRPEEFPLDNNFPNPFPTPSNPSTTIPFVLPEPSHVTIEVFDILGRRVRTLINEDLPSGPASVRWDGTNNSGRSVASGVYFYRMVALGASGQSSRNVKKLTVLR